MAAQPAHGILYTKPLEAVIFSHQDHVQKGTTCGACHSGLFEMEALHAQNQKDFTMDSLYKGKYCGACHNGKKAFASDTQCARCHVGSGVAVPQKETPAYKTSVLLGKGERGVVFNHESHLKKTSCRTCHNTLFKPSEGSTVVGMADHSGGKFCFTCHDQKGKNTFSWNDCNRCHKKSPAAPKETIKYGKGAKAVSFQHESHQLKAGCKACHPKLFAYRRSEVKIDFNDHADGKSCFTCHASKNGSAFYDCNRCHKDKPAVKKPAYYPGTLKYKTPMQNVYFHHASHAVFACNQCHPQPFAVKKGQTKMMMSEMLNGKTCGICHNGTKSFSARDCGRCHKK
jgi:c(7)-type cytochrome triheme protein